MHAILILHSDLTIKAIKDRKIPNNFSLKLLKITNVLLQVKIETVA